MRNENALQQSLNKRVADAAADLATATASGWPNGPKPKYNIKQMTAIRHEEIRIRRTLTYDEAATLAKRIQ